MDSTTEQLLAWLRARIADEHEIVSDWPDVLEALPDDVPFWRDADGRPVLEPRPVAVNRLRSWSRILDFAEGMALPEDTLPYLPFGKNRELVEQLRGMGTLGGIHLVRLVGVAFQYHPDYQAEWRPGNDDVKEAPSAGAHGT